MSADKRFRKVALVEIAVHRLRRRFSRGRNRNESGELAITISDEEMLEADDSSVRVDSDVTSKRDTDSEVEKYRGPANLSTSECSMKTPRRSPKAMLNKYSRAPEQAITLFAFRLAILEKISRGAGALTFVWATVVLLGGFSQYVSSIDFWVVTILLLTEGSRIFFLSHELEWQQARFRSRSSYSFYELGSNFARKSSRVVSGLIHRSPVSSSSRDGRWATAPSPSPGPARTRPNGVRGYGSPPSQAPSAAAQTSKRAQRIAATLRSKSATRTWSASMLPLLPYTQVISAKNMATFLYLGEVVSAFLCLALSGWRFVLQDFLDGDTPGTLKNNIAYSLFAFYAMALVEALIFLVEKMYWEYKITYTRLFERVDKKAQLKGECVDTIRSFFYQVYSRSLATSVFTGLEMDLVSYSMELLQGNDEKEVLGGSKILKAFAEKSHAFQSDTLRRIGITPGAIDRLVEMLAWHHTDEKEIRLNSAAIVKALVSSTRNSSRVIAVSGSLENIMSLIQWDDVDRLLHVEGENAASPPREVIELRTYGLGILKYLALDHVNCLRIGETRGLLAKLVDFINVHGHRSIDTAEGCKTIRQSLQLLKMLASTTGKSGSTLRVAIANVVSAIPHLRDILHAPATELWKDLHEHAVDVLKNLALDERSREIIGSTGGVISNLMLLFTRQLNLMPFRPVETSAKDAAVKEEINLAKKAGKVLMRLALQNKENCNRILRTRFREPCARASTVLLRILRDEENVELGIHAAQILRAIFVYMSPSMQEEVSQHSEFLLKTAISCTDRRVREAALGLAIALPSLNDQDFSSLFETQRVDRNRLVDSLLQCLNHAPSTTRRPRIRRYSLELIFILLKRDEAFRCLFSGKDLPSLLIEMLDNISDVENYLLFSGGMGLTRHKEDMESLMLRLLEKFDVGDR